MSLRKGCLTCRDRRIRCDRALPSCGQCSRSKRSCGGYTLRLSWPKEHDRRRAMLGAAPPRTVGSPRVSGARMVSTTSWDFEMREYLVELQTKDRSQMTPPIQPSVPWAPYKLQTEETGLLQYFEAVVVQSLATIGRTPCGLMLRMALSERTPASTAVLTSILALASLHRFGRQLRADHFKVSAVQALAASSGAKMSAKEGMQHVAAGMLLCTFEIQQPSDTSSNWLVYICGAKTLINVFGLVDACELDGDRTALMDWVYYHDSLSRFSVRHWRRFRSVQEAFNNELKLQGVETWARCKDGEARPTPRPVTPIHELLSILSQVCDSLLDPSDPGFHADGYRSHLKFLQWKLLKLEGGRGEATSANRCVEAPCMFRLVQLTALVYLERAAGGGLSRHGHLEGWIDEAFDLLSGMPACPRSFPLLIFGCEARSDAQRMILLDLVARTEENAPVRNLDMVMSFIRCMWVQDDLAVPGEEIRYLEKLSAVLGSSSRLPPFV